MTAMAVAESASSAGEPVSVGEASGEAISVDSPASGEAISIDSSAPGVPMSMPDISSCGVGVPGGSPGDTQVTAAGEAAGEAIGVASWAPTPAMPALLKTPSANAATARRAQRNVDRRSVIMERYPPPLFYPSGLPDKTSPSYRRIRNS